MNTKPKHVMGKQTTGNGHREYDHSHNSFHEAIGITPERRDKLLDTLTLILMTTEKKSETFEALYQIPDSEVSPAEKGYLTYMLGILAYENGDVVREGPLGGQKFGGQTPWLN